MSIFANILPIIQIVICVSLILSILLQNRGGSAGGVFGGGGASYYTKRGFEKALFAATIILGILFVASAIVSLLIR